MTALAQKLLDQARTLGRDELLELVERLTRELDERQAPELTAAELAELDARSQAMEQGDYTEYENAKAFMDSLRSRAADSVQQESREGNRDG